MTIKLNDRSLFGNEAAEDESDDVFESYAVIRPEIERFLSQQERLVIARAYKGEGKSALLRLVAKKLEEVNEDIVLRVSAPSLSPEVASDDSDEWVRGWKQRILKHAASEIGARIHLAFSDDAIALVEEAEGNGYKSRSFVGSVIDRLKSASIPIDRVRQGVGNPERVLQRWSANRPNVWFVIDDIDQNFSGSPRNRLKVATFFIALRQISNLIPEFRFRTCVRPNVWAMIKREFEGLSHSEQYITTLSWSERDFTQLLANRVSGYLKRNDVHENTGGAMRELVARVFDDPMPWNQGLRSPSTVLYTLARHRPRWLVELCREAATSAHRRERNKINLDDIVDQLPIFGRRRIEDTIAEFSSQCAQIEALITAFVDQPNWFSTDQLYSVINNRVLQSVQPKIVGVLGTANATDVASFLYQIGFLTARRELGGGNYEHELYAEKPDLLTTATNRDQGYSWEVHPVFRQPLRLKKVE
ncbi:P-loop ATPase, Sll1717 family [Frateuria aurantia]